MVSMPAALRCEKLVKDYEDLRAVDGVDLEVEAGACFGLLGPNGAGKTTTVEILEGLTPPSSGRVEILGRTWGGDEAALRDRLGVQLQETRLDDKLTVEETLALFRSFHARKRPLDEVIALLELQDKRKARYGKLSGGQKQRVALGCALVGDPDILFLDEPTTGLDPQARRKVWEVVEDCKARGVTVLLTTHYMEEAARLCGRVAIMDKGKVIALDKPRELIRSLGAEQILELHADRPLSEASLSSLPGVSRAEPRGEGWVLSVSQMGRALPALLSLLEKVGTQVQSLTTHEATLEDVFLHLTGRSLRDD